MKMKHLFGLVAVVTVTGFAASAQAGWSVGISFPAPVVFAPAVVVAAPSCLPPVVYRPASVVYVAPRYERHYDYRDQRGYDHGRDQRGWGRDDRGHNRGGRR